MDKRRNQEVYIDSYKGSSPPLKIPILSPEVQSHVTFPPKWAIPSKNDKTTGLAKQKRVEEVIHGQQWTVLPLFGSQDATEGAVSPGPSKKQQLNDVLFFCGGPIWALDWCPAASGPQGEESSLQYLAVSAHPKDRTQNPLGCPVEGLGLVQIWEVAHKPEKEGGSTPMPRLCHAIQHNHGLVWDLRWAPNSAGHYSNDQSLGTLAMLFGDGEIQLLSIPKPQSQPGSSERDAENGTSDRRPMCNPIAIQPDILLSKENAPRLGSCMDWLSCPPYDLILVGCWDGSVLVLRIPDQSQGTNRLDILAHIIADEAAIRSICFAPPAVALQANDKSERHLFLTAGHSCYMKIWDWRDPYLPVLNYATPVSWAMEARWLHNPDGVLYAQDDGGLRFLELNASHRPACEQNLLSQVVWWGPTSGTTWTCRVDPVSDCTAYGGVAGNVVVAPPGFPLRTRKRPAHVIVSSTTEEDGRLRMGGQEQPTPVNGSKPATQKGVFPNPACAIHCVRWGRASAQEPQGTWLASGGATGILRCQRVSYLSGL